MDYAKFVIEQYQKKMNNVANNIKKKNIFPNRNNPLLKLSLGEELILKITFALRVAFLDEMKFLFAYCYPMEKFETLVIDLERQQYIESRTSKIGGKHWILTKNALFYFYCDHSEDFSTCRIDKNTMPNENSLMLYKTINGYFADKIFKQLTEDLKMQYETESHDYRYTYPRKQFISQYLFPSTGINYSKTACKEYCEQMLPELETNAELKEQCRRFIKAYKENSVKHYTNETLLTFSFLKDYYNEIHSSRDLALRRTYELFKGTFNNICKENFFTFRNDLYKLSMESPCIKSEFTLFLTNEIVRQLTIQRRALLNTKTENKSLEELKEVKDKLTSLDAAIEKYSALADSLSENFEVMLFDHYGTTDIPVFKENVLTLESLKNVQVYIINADKQPNGRTKLTFGIFQASTEDFYPAMLFTRIEKIFAFAIRNLLMFDYEIKIFTYSSKHKDSVIDKLAIVKDTFSDLTQYSLLLPKFDEIEVISTEMHMKERYEVFRNFRTACKTF